MISLWLCAIAGCVLALVPIALIIASLRDARRRQRESLTAQASTDARFKPVLIVFDDNERFEL